MKQFFLLLDYLCLSAALTATLSQHILIPPYIDTERRTLALLRWVRSLTVLQDGTLASGSDDKTIRLWDTKTGQSTKALELYGISLFIAVLFVYRGIMQ